MRRWLSWLRPGLLEIRDEYDVAVEVAARQSKLLSVERPGVIQDQIVLEVGQLLWRSAGQRLFPEITDAIARQHVVQRFAIRRPVECEHGCGRGKAIQGF